MSAPRKSDLQAALEFAAEQVKEALPKVAALQQPPIEYLTAVVQLAREHNVSIHVGVISICPISSLPGAGVVQ